jgi:hypothetical protein
MRDIQQLTAYYHAAYAVGAVLFGGYVLSLFVRARRARNRVETSRRP